MLMLMQCRTLAVSALTLSILVYTKILSGYWVVFYLPAFLKLPPQLWRLFTSFLITGPSLGILFDTYFCKDWQTSETPVLHFVDSDVVYTYGSKLETASPRFSQPGDFFTYIVFVCLTVLVGHTSPDISMLYVLGTSHICPHSAMLPTIAVPGDEEDYPCTSAGPTFAINP